MSTASTGGTAIKSSSLFTGCLHVLTGDPPGVDTLLYSDVIGEGVVGQGRDLWTFLSFNVRRQDMVESGEDKENDKYNKSKTEHPIISVLKKMIKIVIDYEFSEFNEF